MKHFNNSVDGNVNLGNTSGFSPQFSPESSRIERIILLLLISFGILGVFFTINAHFKGNRTSSISKITTNVSQQPFLQAGTKTLIAPKEVAKKASLGINGLLETNQKITFTIKNFDAKAKYLLLTGDGKTLDVTKNTIAYEYKSTGKYRVQLKTIQNGKTEKVCSKNIMINNFIAVAPGAEKEF